MGGIFSSIFGKGSDNLGVIPNFDNPREPETAEDIALYDESEKLVVRSKTMIEKLEKYTFATEIIKQAIEDPDSENECFGQVLESIAVLSEFWQFSSQIGDVVVRLLTRLGDIKEGKESALGVASSEALSKQYAEILSFCITWDFMKMMKSNLQNDLSFYRRCMDRQASNYELPVSQDHTAYISMFLAESLPMLKAICTKLKEATNKGNTQLFSTLARFSDAGRIILQKKKWGESSPNYEILLRALTGSFVIYDHISDKGVFKSKEIKAQDVVKTVHKWENVQITGTMKSLIMYGAPNFNRDANKKIRDMCGA